jgi:hypothetical protein
MVGKISVHEQLALDRAAIRLLKDRAGRAASPVDRALPARVLFHF